MLESGATVDLERVYVVYMGAANSPEASRDNQLHLLASVLDRKDGKQQQQLGQIEKTLIVHTYKHGFSGFAARLSKKEADRLAGKAGVVSVFEDPLYQLHTTRSWDFLQYTTDLKIDHSSSSSHAATSTSDGTDTIIGLLDTGIWPESESFKDNDMGPIPSRWKGLCMQGHDFSTSNCNRKLIGARYYSDASSTTDEKTPRDSQGHGTHTASTAAGNSVADASYYGLAQGTAKGGSPGSRIAVYKVCTSGGCRGSAILAAFDDAIADGVDVLSLSLGGSSLLGPDFSTDPVAIGAFHAVDKGITVVCSAGNEGPTTETVVNAAPWILTVAASTIDRDFESDVILAGGNNKKVVVIKGEAINFSTLEKSPIYPLIEARSAKTNSSSESDARNCNLGSLDGSKIKGKIVVCEHSDDSYLKREKMEGIKKLDGIGLVLIDDLYKAVASYYGAFPMTVISSQQAADVISYINSTSDPMATILATQSVTNYKPAPTVVYFSSRGPSRQTRNLLKPDITAPGVNILAAWTGSNTSETPSGQKPLLFNLLSGTSMSCPHVSGVAAAIKSTNPTWSPSTIRSAIMTTALQSNNEKSPLTTDSGSAATPYDYGAGEISPTKALQPGLVYETDTSDYLQFLCNYGYDVSSIKLISDVPNGFECSKNSSKDLISQLNYPSIAISNFDGKDSKQVTRTVTNIAATDDQTVYTARVESPKGLEVKVVPDKLEFTRQNTKLSYQVVFSSTSPSLLKSDMFGSITWTNSKYKVQTPFVVSSQ